MEPGNPAWLAGDRTLDAVRASMDVASMRHALMAGNIANARTPGYRPVDVDFSRAVQAAREKLQSERSGAEPSAARDALSSDAAPHPVADAPFNGISYVDAHREMARMTENALRYGALAQMASTRLRGLQGIVSEGRR